MDSTIERDINRKDFPESQISGCFGSLVLGFLSALLFQVFYVAAFPLDAHLDAHKYLRYFTDNYFIYYLPAILFVITTLGTAITLLYISYRKYKSSAIVGLLLGYVIVMAGTPNIQYIKENTNDYEGKQNLHSIQLGLVYRGDDSKEFPVEFSDFYVKNKDRTPPRTMWYETREKSRKYKHREAEYLQPGWGEFIESQKAVFDSTSTPMLNLATGYEQGKNYFEWWNCTPLEENDDEKRIALRCAFAGNFLYIPLDEKGDMLPYNTDKTEVTMANLYLFGSPANDGYDAWTPTGDPNKPVKLESDGIPDGVIIMLPLGSEEEDDGE